MKPQKESLVYTIKERCRVCYTCVRECPAKAIKIVNGQADIITERCIACGNCIKVCSQDAKFHLQSADFVLNILSEEVPVVAMIAPSFAAEFTECSNYQTFVGMVRRLGFKYVVEVGFGADLVAKRYKEILQDEHEYHYISSDCPAIVGYIEKYHPNLVKSLAPIVSPLMAMNRVVKKKYGNSVKVVFIGPCIAKKQESEEVDAVITFRELRTLFSCSNIKHHNSTPSEFDGPLAGKGAIFPLQRGLLHNVNIKEDPFEGNVLVASGRQNFQSAIKEFENGLIKSQHLELLCCEGCIMGPGMSIGGKQYSRSTHVSSYVKEKLSKLNNEIWEKEIEEYRDLDLSRHFSTDDQRMNRPSEEQIQEVLQNIGKISEKDRLDCGACGYDTCVEHAIAIIQGQAEVEMCLPYSIENLHNYINELAKSNEKLISVQEALKHSEKLAHMGQLSAGIAHELNNPLGVIIMYANLLLDESSVDSEIRKDLELIVEQSDRCKKIVGGLLNFARKNQINLVETDANLLIRQCLNSLIIPNEITITQEFKAKNPYIFLDSEQMIQAITNLIKNALEAMPQENGSLKILLHDDPDNIFFEISDNGHGIAKENMDKLFTPFFTTKGIGKGTGLGLPTTYGIVKMHKGNIDIKTNTDPNLGETGTTFTIIIPRKNH